MTRRGLVLASYGTTRQDARRRDIEPLARDLCAAAPGAPFCEAYLSAPVRRMLRRKGVSAPGALGDALAALADVDVVRACLTQEIKNLSERYYPVFHIDRNFVE